MPKNAAAGPSRTPIAHTSSEVSIDQPGIAALRHGNNGEVNITPSQPTPSIPDLAYSTNYTSGGTFNNASGNILNTINYHGVPLVASINPMQPLTLFNDAPVDHISSCFMGRVEEIQIIASALGLVGHHTHTIWVSATTMEKVSQGMANVLDLMQHPERHNPDQAARLMAVRLCLQHSQQHGFLKWLIILDDVTLETVPFLRENLLRQNSHGSILITARTADIAEAIMSVAGERYPVHALNALSAESSAALFLTWAGISAARHLIW
ncbi:hypothetical protein FIBSPDRAFT_893522 [Athelia psychrophila]|uniref:NB-ARC domain-containing protein n=1 Tax=Athelia psychrophila TaxID=1759441 RepID=A0A166H0F8_9AGAM|nr:hypothetical protein FIBSPDRAFT_893522 [Fibularhizoctonia sp. CBS 109695]